MPRLDVRHLRDHAQRAIDKRLHGRAREAVRAVERDGSDVILGLNSGGNSLAVEQALRERGYRDIVPEGNPDGLRLRVEGGGR